MEIVLIQELNRQESTELLGRSHLGRLGCALGGQPYIAPIYFAYRDNYIYSFATVGRKIEWMRLNPLVCVETDEVASSDKWTSVIVLGRYEELPDKPKWQSERTFAYELLSQKALWWEPGSVKTILHGTERPLVPVFYRIDIAEISGHRATPELRARGSSGYTITLEEARPLRDLWHKMFGSPHKS